MVIVSTSKNPRACNTYKIVLIPFYGVYFCQSAIYNCRIITLGCDIINYVCGLRRFVASCGFQSDRFALPCCARGQLPLFASYPPLVTPLRREGRQLLCDEYVCLLVSLSLFLVFVCVCLFTQMTQKLQGRPSQIFLYMASPSLMALQWAISSTT